MESIKIDTEYIKLDQFLKWSGIVGSGYEGKLLVNDGKVVVNGEIELKRGRKIRTGDIIQVENKVLRVE